MEQKLAAWIEATLAPLNDEQIQKMLKTEFGGMNEVLGDLYADTGDKRWLNLSQRFDDRSIADISMRPAPPVVGDWGTAGNGK